MANYFYCYVDEDTHPHILITEYSEKEVQDYIKINGRLKGVFFLSNTGETKILTASSVPMLVVPPERMKEIMGDYLQKLEARISLIKSHMPS